MTVRLLLLLALMLASMLAGARPIVPGVWSWPAGPCSVDYHVAQGVVALACPGRDLLRLWPLPPAGPWFEDPEEPPAQIAAR